MRRSAILAVCLAAAFTTLLDQSSLNTAVPALRSSLDAGPATIQWIIAGYSLTFGLALIPAGRLGDAHGRKRLFLAGLVIFTAGAIVAATAGEAWLVAAARLVQGAGAGTVNPQVLGLIQDHFTGRDRVRALGAYATAGGVAGVIGPVTGGGVIDLAGQAHGWRLVLLLNVPFALLTLPAAARLLPGGRFSSGHRPSLDLPGLALLAAATLGLMLPFVTHGGPAGPVLLLGAAAGLALWERFHARRGGTPILLPAQRISATVSMAAVSGALLAKTGRAGVTLGVAICAAQLVVAGVLAGLDAPERSPAERVRG